MDACEIAWQAVRGRPRFDIRSLCAAACAPASPSRFALPVGNALSTAVLNEKYSRASEFTEVRISSCALACAPAELLSSHVCPRPGLLRCQRDQARLLDPTASADPS